MLIILSPSKTQDFTSISGVESSIPRNIEKANYLNALLKKFDKPKLSKLMSLSNKLCDLSYTNIQQFQEQNASAVSKQAIFAYTGEVFNKISPPSFSKEELSYSQSSIRILSGLYGVLKPLDLIQPYRLKMAEKLITKEGSRLVDYWKEYITNMLNLDESEFIVNLASKEYVNSIHINKLKAKFISIHFNEKKENEYKVIGVFAKQARGMMVRFIVKNKISNPKLLKNFNRNEYEFNSSLSTKSDWVFTRD